MSTNEALLQLELRSPWLNAAGSFGFAPEARLAEALASFGAFVTNPISVRPRRAGQEPRLLTFPGGALLHTGYPNPGVNAAVKRFAAAWARAPLPVIVHLLSDKPEETRKAVLRLEECENVMAIELGLEADVHPSELADALQAMQGELPIIAQLPLLRATELAQAAIDAGAAAISLGPPRGSLPGAKGKLVTGRLYGPALFPLALETIRQLGKLPVPLIAAGGVESKAQGEAMLAAGATAVQAGIGLWKRGEFS